MFRDDLAFKAPKFVELFAGTAMATRCVQAAGFPAYKLDLEDAKTWGRSSGEGTVYDILAAKGFAWLAFKLR